MQLHANFYLENYCPNRIDHIKVLLLIIKLAGFAKMKTRRQILEKPI